MPISRAPGAKSITTSPDPARGVYVTTTTDLDTGTVTVTEAPMPVEEVNANTLLSRARAAVNANANYLAIASPTVAQRNAQLDALTRQVQALIRIVANKLDATD